MLYASKYRFNILLVNE